MIIRYTYIYINIEIYSIYTYITEVYNGDVYSITVHIPARAHEESGACTKNVCMQEIWTLPEHTRKIRKVKIQRCMNSKQIKHVAANTVWLLSHLHHSAGAILLLSLSTCQWASSHDTHIVGWVLYIFPRNPQFGDVKTARWQLQEPKNNYKEQKQLSADESTRRANCR